MRTLVKIFIAVVIIGAAFGTYWWLQPAMHLELPRVAQIGPAASRPTVDKDGLIFKEGDSVWVKQYDDQGRISYQFKADEYTPVGGGNVNVKQPRTVFYFKAGKKRAPGESPVGEKRSRLEIDGVDGNITVQNAPEAPKDGIVKKDQFSHGAMQPPKRGRLHTVKIRLYDDENADPDVVAPSLTMVTDNIAFDNETFRIFTEGYKDAKTGEEFAADRVKVVVNGNYDFIGYGLTVRWNDLDQRLELLKVHHGESLTINDMSMLNGGTLGPKKPTVAAVEESNPAVESVSDAISPAALPLLMPGFSGNPDVILVDDSPGKAKKGKKDKGTKPADAAAPLVKTPATKPVKPPTPPYHAVFSDNVVVKQGDQVLAVSDVMNVDFLMDSSKHSGAGASTRPSTKPAGDSPRTKPATTQKSHSASAVATTAPATAPTHEVATTAPATQATTAPAQERITVLWTGPLVMTPAASPDELALTSGETVLQFVGKPAVLTRDGSEARCAIATYRSGTGQMDLHNSGQFPKVLINQAAKEATDPAALPATIRTDWAEYSLLTKVAKLHGQSEARIPIVHQQPAGATTEPAVAANEMLAANWNDLAVFQLAGESESALSIEHADFAGDVDVKHPQMKLKSQHLSLAFDPTGAIKTTDPSADAAASSTSANLKSALATENVWCELADAKGKKQTIVCDRLDLATAKADDGKMYPHIVDATGKVKATDDTQELTAGHVVLTLAPTEKPAQAASSFSEAVADADNHAPVPVASGPLDSGNAAVELRTMVATQAVHVRSADGATAAADTLNVSAEPGVDGRTTVILTGAPARVVDASENVVTGPKIVIHPKESTATVEGAGSMDATQRADATPGATTKPTTRPAADTKPARPLHVTWQDRAIVDGPRNRIDAVGKVTASTPDPDGTVNTAKGDRVVVVMVDKLVPGATTQAAGNSAAKPIAAPAKSPSTKPTDAAAGQFKMDLFKDKEVGTVVLLDQNRATINSNLTAADGTLLRETQLQATSMRFQPRDGQMLIPVPGEMIVRDHRPEEKQPAAKTQPATAGSDSSGRGDTAFKWNKSLAYDQNKRRAVMAGDVLIVHKPEPQKNKTTQPAGKGAPAPAPDEPVRVNADWVAADFEPNDASAKAAVAPGEKPADPGGMRLKTLTAIGNITVTRSTGQLLAQKIVFNPKTNWITATGTPNNPAAFTDLVTGQTTTAAEIWWNSETWDVRFKNITARATR